MKKIALLTTLMVAISVSLFAQQSTKKLYRQKNREIKKVLRVYKDKDIGIDMIDSINARYDRLIKTYLESQKVQAQVQTKEKSWGSTLEHQGPGGNINSSHISSVEASKAYERIAHADARYVMADANAYLTRKIADNVNGGSAGFSAVQTNAGLEGVIANNNRYYTLEVIISSTDGTSPKKSFVIAPMGELTVYLLPGDYKAEFRVNGVWKNPREFSVRAHITHVYFGRTVFFYAYDGTSVAYR